MKRAALVALVLAVGLSWSVDGYTADKDKAERKERAAWRAEKHHVDSDKLMGTKVQGRDGKPLGEIEVLVLRDDFRGVSMLTLHNFSARPRTVAVDPRVKDGQLLVDVFDNQHNRTENGIHQFKLSAYGHRWLRVGALDNTLNRSTF